MNHEQIVIRVQSELKSTQPFYLSGRRICISSRETEVDARLIIESLSTWSGMLLDFADFSPTLGLENASQRGRFVQLVQPAVVGLASLDLEVGLRFLDSVSSAVITCIGPYPGVFKGQQHLIKMIEEICESSDCSVHLKHLVLFMTKSLRALDRCDKGDHATTFRCFLTLTRFLKKIPVDRKDLEGFMEEDYLLDESRLAEVETHLSSKEALVWVRSLNGLAKEIFADFSMQHFCPKHGPGRVAEDGILTTFDKFLNVATDARVDYLLRRHGFGTLENYVPEVLNRTSTRTAKFICVPKTWKTLRGISAEPTELQFSQQAVLYALDEYFQEHPFFRRRLNLHSQVENQRLCREGSLDQSLATIDLSKASDSVSLQLVKEVFRGTKLLPWLLATRSTSVELPGSGIIRTKKFAPMGSSVCFPVECIIFALIAEVARRAIMSGSGRNSVHIPRVFGDDIVCASVTVPLVLDGLEQLGFLPNKEKSFWTGFYRESCGKEYWCGQDITPIYYRVDGGLLASRFASYDGITSLVKLYNSLYLNGYNTARRFILSSLMRKRVRIGERTYLYSDMCVRTFDGEHGTIVSCLPTNFNIKKRVNLAYQCRVVRQVSWKRVYVWSAKILEASDYAQTVKYCEWFLASLRRPVDLESLPTEDSDPYARLPLGYEMVPRSRGVGVTRYDCIG